jgi:hypothetical protein
LLQLRGRHVLVERRVYLVFCMRQAHVLCFGGIEQLRLMLEWILLVGSGHGMRALPESRLGLPRLP